MSSMFAHSRFNKDISQWNVSIDATLGNMFNDSAIEWANDYPSWYRIARPTNRIVARDKDHLDKIVRAVIGRKGPKCDLNYIDVSNVTDMSGLFVDSNFNGDISQWNVSNVTDMSGMFLGSNFNGNISQWDVSKVTNMTGMFEESKFNGDISSWNVSKVTNMTEMFKKSQFNCDISGWDVSSVVEAKSMFENSQFKRNIRSWKLKMRNYRGSILDDVFNGTPNYSALEKAAELLDDDFFYEI